MAYLPLSTANLPNPVIDPAQGASPEDHFDIQLVVGNSTSNNDDPSNQQIVSGFNFQPDFVWGKNRAKGDPYYHVLVDAVRGAPQRLYSNRTDAESTDDGDVEFFTSDGFKLGSGLNLNNNGDSNVFWCWKANGSGVSNTDGDFSVTVSANAESGFSIVDLTDPNTGASYEVGHGLNNPPEMFFIKKTNTTSDWSVYHKDVGNDRRLVLNSLDAQSASSSVYFGSTTPTSTVVTIGSGLSTGDDWIMYCFHSVDGFSKFGSYQGGSDPFVYLGFEPAMIIFKRADGTATHWAIRDNTRYTYNPNRYTLYPSKTDTEYTGTLHDIDFLSNGFKIRNGDGLFDASAKYIYAAWAKAPFKYGTGV